MVSKIKACLIAQAILKLTDLPLSWCQCFIYEKRQKTRIENSSEFSRQAFTSADKIQPHLCITQLRCNDQLSNRMKAEVESSSSSAKTEVILLKLLLPLIEAHYSNFARHSPKMSHINNCQGRIKKLVFVSGKTPKTGVGHGQDSLTYRMCL